MPGYGASPGECFLRPPPRYPLPSRAIRWEKHRYISHLRRYASTIRRPIPKLVRAGRAHFLHFVKPKGRHVYGPRNNFGRCGTKGAK